MILNPQLGADGRLGNQLFQQAAVRALGLVKGYEVGVPALSKMVHHGQSSLITKFKMPLTPWPYAKPIQYNFFRELDYMKYDPDFWNIKDNTFLNGYFQSINYFKPVAGLIREEFVPKDEFQEEGSDFVSMVRSTFDKKVVSIHLRRGDNTDGSNPNTLLNNMYGTCKRDFWDSPYGQYLEAALQPFHPDEYVLLVFTGGNRFTEDNLADVEWCRSIFDDEVIVSNCGNAMKDYCRIRACDAHILSPVSSFGWWAAYTSINQGLTIAPNHYHPDLPEFTYREGFYPEDWVLC